MKIVPVLYIIFLFMSLQFGGEKSVEEAKLGESGGKAGALQAVKAEESKEVKEPKKPGGELEIDNHGLTLDDEPFDFHKVESLTDPNGPGENGEGIEIIKDALSPEERKLYDLGWQRCAYNQYASDMMSLHRSLPDTRPEECGALRYPADLPDTSVVICFHNEVRAGEGEI